MRCGVVNVLIFADMTLRRIRDIKSHVGDQRLSAMVTLLAGDGTTGVPSLSERWLLTSDKFQLLAQIASIRLEPKR